MLLIRPHQQKFGYESDFYDSLRMFASIHARFWISSPKHVVVVVVVVPAAVAAAGVAAAVVAVVVVVVVPAAAGVAAAAVVPVVGGGGGGVVVTIFQMQLFHFTIWGPVFQMVTYSIEKPQNSIINYFSSNIGNNFVFTSWLKWGVCTTYNAVSFPILALANLEAWSVIMQLH